MISPLLDVAGLRVSFAGKEVVRGIGHFLDDRVGARAQHADAGGQGEREQQRNSMECFHASSQSHPRGNAN